MLSCANGLIYFPHLCSSFYAVSKPILLLPLPCSPHLTIFLFPQLKHWFMLSPTLIIAIIWFFYDSLWFIQNVSVRIIPFYKHFSEVMLWPPSSDRLSSFLFLLHILNKHLVFVTILHFVPLSAAVSLLMTFFFPPQPCKKSYFPLYVSVPYLSPLYRRFCPLPLSICLNPLSPNKMESQYVDICIFIPVKST